MATRWGTQRNLGKQGPCLLSLRRFNGRVRQPTTIRAWLDFPGRRVSHTVAIYQKP